MSKTATKAPKVSAAQQRVLASIKENGAMTDAELAEELSTSPSGARRTALSLVKSGALVQAQGRFGIPSVVLDSPEATEPTTDEPDFPQGAAMAIVSCVERQARNAVQEQTKAGSIAVATVDNGYVTKDGRYAMVKINDDKKLPWLLYSVKTKANGDLRGIAQIGQGYASSSKCLEKIAEVAK